MTDDLRQRLDQADDDLAAEIDAEAAAPCPYYRRHPDGTSGAASNPDFGYIAERRRQRVERLLDGRPDDDFTRAVRAYIDVARCLETPKPRRTR
jgi:hypothetical protein